MLFGDADSSWANTTAIGLLAAVLAGLGRIIWWFLPRAIKAHTSAVECMTETNREQSVKNAEAIAALVQDHKEDRLRQEERCDKSHARRDEQFTRLTEAIDRLVGYTNPKKPPDDKPKLPPGITW